MFNTLASYLLGNSNRNTDQADNSNNNNNNNNNTIVSEIDDAEFLKDNINLTATSCDEDDWLFVDREDEEDSLPRTDSEEESTVVVIKNSPLVRNRASKVNDELLYAAPSPSTTTTVSLPATINMEESWFVTPPPCFTSTGPIHMETSPFEDLLIEHPSMSVYLSLRSSNPFDFEDDIIVVDIPEQEPTQQPIAERRTNHAAHTSSVPRGAVRNDHLAQHQKKQLMIIRNIQKNHEHQKRQSMCRNVIERTNKVREVNTKGGRQKRCDMSHCKTSSRANNNRKC